MAEQAQDRTGKPPAITVRAASWEDYDWITAAAERRSMSRGEFLLGGALQRKTGGPLPKSRAQLRAEAKAAANGGQVATSAEAKADVVPRPKGGR